MKDSFKEERITKNYIEDKKKKKEIRKVTQFYTQY